MLDQLNKHQLILLSLLISFVTSIATGIITFSLLQQAPPTVTQTINRVVEQTIQQVTSPSTTGGNTVKETTVVVKEDDQVVGAISQNTPSIVRVSDNTTTPDPFYSLGIVLTKSGLIVTPARSTFNAGYTYTAKFSDATTQTLKYMGQDNASKAVFFKVMSSSGNTFSGNPVTLESSLAKLGQTVVLLEGETNNAVSVGHVSAYNFTDPADPKTQNGVETDLTPKTTVLGCPLFNLSAEFVGFRISDTTSSGDPIYLSPETLATAITQYSK
jgi:hypothetical protein